MKLLVKTFGWAILSGIIFLLSALVAGADFWPAWWATVIAVVCKTPAYAGYEWAFHKVWPAEWPKAEPFEHAAPGPLTMEGTTKP